MTNTSITLLVAACAGVVSFVAYSAWVVGPTWGAYTRAWERLAALALSVYVLISFVGVGIGAGIGGILLWDRLR